jgi:hypothetical protein
VPAICGMGIPARPVRVACRATTEPQRDFWRCREADAQCQLLEELASLGPSMRRIVEAGKHAEVAEQPPDGRPAKGPRPAAPEGSVRILSAHDVFFEA